MPAAVVNTNNQMAKIKPFQALVYNQEKVADLSRVICPPYDVISAADQEYYLGLHPNNFIHILLRKDKPGEDKYQRSGEHFKSWIKDNILVQEQRPAIYFYHQQYILRGEKKCRLGFICLLYLEDKKSSIFCHEHTRLAAKEDRFKMLKSVRANLSPIFVAFPDKKRIIQRVYQRYVQGRDPTVKATDKDKTEHRLWRLDDPEVIAGIGAAMKDADIFIADGHHRYEVAIAWRDEMRQKMPYAGEDAPFNYCLTYFTSADSRDLTILPIHRLLRPKKKIETMGFLAALKEYFDVEEVKDRTKFFFLMERGGRAEHVLGCYIDGRYWLLRLKNVKILDKIISDKPAEYRALDVSILNYIIFHKILGMGLEDNSAIVFNPNAEELIEQVNKDALAVAFFLNPVKMQQIISVSSGGNRMPPKSTYFYPKIASGFVVNRLDKE